jgi:hypothetical protein
MSHFNGRSCRSSRLSADFRSTLLPRDIRDGREITWCSSSDRTSALVGRRERGAASGAGAGGGGVVGTVSVDWNRARESLVTWLWNWLWNLREPRRRLAMVLLAVRKEGGGGREAEEGGQGGVYVLRRTLPSGEASDLTAYRRPPHPLPPPAPSR